MCAGVDATKGLDKWSPEEIPNQIAITRKQSSPGGYVLWNMKHTARNSALCSRLRSEINLQTALVPALTWIDRPTPSQPVVKASDSKSATHQTVSWGIASAEDVRFWVVQSRTDGGWTTEIFPSTRMSQTFPRASLEAVCVTAIGRSGIASSPGVLEIAEARNSTERLTSPKMR